MSKLKRCKLKAIIPFITFLPVVLFQLTKTRTKDELIEFREWIFASKEVLVRISNSSKLSKYRKMSELGLEFDELTRKEISRVGFKSIGVISNNEYLNGGGYKASKIFAIDKFLQFDLIRKSRYLSENNVFFFGPEWASSIGHSTNLSILPKLNSNEVEDNSNRILIYTHAANNFYLSLFSNHYSLCRLPEDLKSFVVNYLDECFHPLDAMRVNANEVTDVYSAMTLSERKWNGRPNVSNFLQLPEHVLEEGENFLKITGLTNFEWFVALHLREAPTSTTRGAGNVEVESYVLAIKEILRAGGAVIRLGNPGMSKLEQFDESLKSGFGYFDYANSKFKSETLDIFLMSNCRFMIGTSSGPLFIPKEFGKPVLYSNAPNVGVLPDILGFCLPNLYQDSKGRILSLSEMLEKNEVGWKMSRNKEEFRRIANSEEDLLLATEFMLTKGSSMNFESRVDDLNILANNARKAYGFTSAMPICPSFLSLHTQLML